MESETAYLLDFLKNRVVKDQSVPLNVDTPLVSSGLVDSFALVEVVLELERLFNCRLPIGRIGPQDMDTVAKMLDMVKKLGKLLVSPGASRLSD